MHVCHVFFLIFVSIIGGMHEAFLQFTPVLLPSWHLPMALRRQWSELSHLPPSQFLLPHSIGLLPTLWRGKLLVFPGIYLLWQPMEALPRNFQTLWTHFVPMKDYFSFCNSPRLSLMGVLIYRRGYPWEIHPSISSGWHWEQTPKEGINQILSSLEIDK